jgi:Zn-dependent protease
MNDLIEQPRHCHNCGADLPLGALACEKCHALVYSEELARLTHRANSLEGEDNLPQARQEWTKALPLLPPNAMQAEWVRTHIAKLDLLLRTAPSTPPKHNWARKLGPLAPIVILLSKSKFLLLAIFKLKFLLTLFAFTGLYWSLYGAWFGGGFVALILVHEMGHYLEIRRRGLPAEMPVFLPGLGAYVQWNALGVTRVTRSIISLAGPLAGFIGAAACVYVWHRTGNGVWAALARTTAALNILNLVPVWILDGGEAAFSLSKLERWLLLGVCLLLWLGLGEGVFFLVAAGVVYRLFTKDLPPFPAPKITAFYASVLVGLAVVMHMVPGEIFPHR